MSFHEWFPGKFCDPEGNNFLVYFGGKIRMNDWRHDLFPCLRGALDQETKQVYREVSIQISCRRRVDTLTYAGPYFLGDDHGSGHGPGTHGLAATDVPSDYPYEEDENGVPVDGAAGHPDYEDTAVMSMAWCGGVNFTRRETLNACLGWLKSSDFMFVWVDSDFNTAHGTHFEMGLALAWGKPIIVCGPEHLIKSPMLKEVWFPVAAALALVISETPQEALRIIWADFGGE